MSSLTEMLSTKIQKVNENKRVILSKAQCLLQNSKFLLNIKPRNKSFNKAYYKGAFEYSNSNNGYHSLAKFGIDERINSKHENSHYENSNYQTFYNSFVITLTYFAYLINKKCKFCVLFYLCVDLIFLASLSFSS